MSALPVSVRAAAESLALYAPVASLGAEGKQILQTLQTAREAVNVRRKIRLDYQDGSGSITQRVVRPLGCFFWGRVWTLAAWCESRHDFRSFRIASLPVLDEPIKNEPDKSLAQFLRNAGAPPV